jgi:hypothetical protein
LWGATIPGQPAGTRVRWYVEAAASNAAQSVSYLPVGAEHDVYTYIITPLAAPGPVVINEVMASNSSTVTDNAGQYDDWIELYNKGTVAAAIGGYYLTDNAANLDKWKIPAGTTIPAGGYLMLWADEDSSQGSNHMNFKLSASGEFVYLLDASGALVDSVSFGTLPTDQSYARSPNGTGPWVVKGPTFGINNDLAAGVATIVAAAGNELLLYPNPTRDAVNIVARLTAPVEIRTAAGSLVYHGNVNGQLQITTQGWAPGIYFVRCGQNTARLVVQR